MKEVRVDWMEWRKKRGETKMNKYKGTKGKYTRVGERGEKRWEWTRKRGEEVWRKCTEGGRRENSQALSGNGV